MTSGAPVAEPFPFIVACGRPGTTPLRAMLERGGEIAIPPESYFPVSLAERHAGTSFDPARFTAALRANIRFREWDIEAPDVSGLATYPDAVRAVYAGYARSRG